MAIKEVQKIQRALVLQGGGALGAYEVGVIKALYEKLTKEDNKNENKDKPLFDIIAGTSIGAINGAILISQVLKNNGNWRKSIEKLEEFWKTILSSNPNYKSLWDPWAIEKHNPTAASEESARRYYSVQSFFLTGATNVFTKPTAINDNRFYDNYFNKWYRSDYAPLKESIEKYADFPIATNFDKNQPRLIIISVDVLDAATVTFDSYEKPEYGRRESRYRNYKEKTEDQKFIIEYDKGISIDYVMASASVPEFYDYTTIQVQKSKSNKQNNDKNNSESEIVTNLNYFWDGAILSNTPLRELIQTHRDYWKEVQKIQVPDLEVYIVDLWPSKKSMSPPLDRNGIKDLQDTIQYSNKTSYDEKIAKIITDYVNLSQKLIELAKEKGANLEEIKEILDEFATSSSRSGRQRQYKHLLEGRFKITRVIRIERSEDPDSIWGKVADFTSETINKLMEQGYRDTLNQT
ncbi:MAG: patatin-like phospholipase family protein [Nitrosopumilus sp.]|nr:patatin-like phospholipase family protein [Nitrosopumilus sp.]